MRSLVERFWSKVEPMPSGCWEWTGSVNPGGYGTIHIGPERNRSTQAHRVSAEFAIGPCPNGQEVCHTCDNRKCVRPAHLFYGTRMDNVHDAMAKGRFIPPPRMTSEIARRASASVWATRRLRYGQSGHR